MKKKISEAKTHLSRLVKEVNETGEPLELCVREETVAYIVPAKEKTDAQREHEELVQKLEDSGLRLVQRGRPPSRICPVSLSPETLREGNAVLKMRAEKDY